MKNAFISSVRVPGVQAFGWKWKSEDGIAGCRDTFKYFHDCLDDARKHGYQAQFGGGGATSSSPPAARGGRRSAPGDRHSQ